MYSTWDAQERFSLIATAQDERKRRQKSPPTKAMIYVKKKTGALVSWIKEFLLAPYNAHVYRETLMLEYGLVGY